MYEICTQICNYIQIMHYVPNMQNEIDTKILKSLRFVDIFNIPVSNLSTDRYVRICI